MTDQARHPLARAAIRNTIIGLVVNALLVVVKMLAGVLGHSYALVADAVESALDVFGSLIVWGGIAVGARPPDRDHPYGHGKAEPLAAIFVSLLLIGAAVWLSVESVKEILNPVDAPEFFTLPVLGAIILVKEVLFRKVLAVGEAGGSAAVNADAWHHRSDALTSAAAFIGIAIALLGGKGYESADDWAALFACAIIAWNGVRILRPALNEVMDAATYPEIEDEIRRQTAAIAGVEAIEQCRVRKYGLHFVVDIHVEVRGELSVSEGHRIAHLVKDKLLSSKLNISDALVHIEPAGASDGSGEISA